MFDIGLVIISICIANLTNNPVNGWLVFGSGLIFGSFFNSNDEDDDDE